MKRKLQIISASAASVLALAAVAQDLPNPKTDRPAYSQDRRGQQRADRLNGAAKASDLIGMTVNNYQDEKLGKVDDLALDVESGRIVQVILSTGGFLGIGDQLTAVPPGALHHDVAQKVLHLEADKAKLKGAPKFDNSKWDEGTQSTQVTEVYSYYDEQPYFGVNQHQTSEDIKLDGTNTDTSRTLEKNRNTEAGNSAQTQNTLATRNAKSTNHNGAQTQNTRSIAKADRTLNREVGPNANDNNRRGAYSQNPHATRNADGSWNGQSDVKENGNSSPANLGYVQKASKLMGTTVKNRQDEKLGTVENILLDLSSGRIVSVIISTGGFLGMGDELSAVPASALQFTAERDSLQLDASKEMLSSAPHFKANQWPDFNEPSYTHGIYRDYNIEPYFPASNHAEGDNTRRNVRDRDNRAVGAQAPDNTGRNVRDRDDRTLTPLDQGNSQSDVDTTAQIRKEIIAGENMSVTARNVKIITKNGQVTLRGPVNTDEEKRLIGEIAHRVARSGNVDNQLEVKRAKSNY